MMGTSTTFLHWQRTLNSKAILKPIGLHVALPFLKVSLCRAKNPDMGSVVDVRPHANKVAPQLSMRRVTSQSKPKPPPWQYRDPTAKSAVCPRMGSATAG